MANLKRQLLIGLFVSITLILLVGACGDSDDGRELLPGETVGPELREIIEELCPTMDDVVHADCVDVTKASVMDSRIGVLCVNRDTGQWYIATRGATPDSTIGQDTSEGINLGDACGEPGHTVVALVGGGQFGY